MSVKVRNGTPDHSANLCESCVSYNHVQGQRYSQSWSHCGEYGKRLTFPVASCTSYQNLATAKSGEFYKTAWILVPDTDKGVLGIDPAEAHRRRNDGEIPWD